MNTFMWDHPATSTSLDTLRGWGYKVIDPVSKTLACNDTGNGALADVSDIVAAVKSALTATYPVADLRQTAQHHDSSSSPSASLPSDPLLSPLTATFHANLEDSDDDVKVVNALQGSQKTLRERRRQREVLTFSAWLACLLALCSLLDGDMRKQLVAAVQLAFTSTQHRANKSS
jgi:hypothetical protein